MCVCVCVCCIYMNETTKYIYIDISSKTIVKLKWNTKNYSNNSKRAEKKKYRNKKQREQTENK